MTRTCPTSRRTPGPSRFPSDPYLGEVSATDAALGSLFDRLATQSRPTLVVITGDHGESLGDHGELTHSIFAYEPVLRVPLLVAEILPGNASVSTTGVTVDAGVRHVDILPTLLESAGDRAGRDFRARRSETSSPAGDADRPSYFEAMTSTLARGWAPLRGVLVGRDKFIDLPLPELYDLSTDPGEARNLASTRAERAQVLLNTLKGFNVAPPGGRRKRRRRRSSGCGRSATSAAAPRRYASATPKTTTRND